jgi:hypothetical protein
MKRFKYLIGKSRACVLLICIFSFILCSKDEDTNKEPEPDKPEEIIYDEASAPPVISGVDESDYTVYYVDSGALGNDANNGLSETTPFKSLSKITGLAKTPKMKILLKSGARFTGNLILSNLQGTENKPFIVDKYGGETRPVIDGNGTASAVEIREGNIRFRNIRITNKAGNRGIYVTPVVSGALKNVEITGCRIEEVNWTGSDEIIDVNPSRLSVREICPDARYVYQNGGIHFDANTSTSVGASWFENIFITGNEIFKVSRTGIWMDSQWAKRPGITWGHNNYIDDSHGWYPAKNVVVQGNDISYTGGDGVVLIATRDSYIDHNRAYHANYLGRTNSYNVAMWPHSSINFVMQFNEVAYTHLENGASDGEGLDVDIACIDCVVQYNYVHHNDGGGILICNSKSEINGQERIGDHRGTIVRNNVFYDNGKDVEKPAFLVISSAVGKTDLYNNTVVVSNRRPDIKFVLSADWENIGKSKDITFRNNIFVTASQVSARFDILQITNCKFENNLVFPNGNSINTTIADKKLLVFDPKITIPAALDGYENGLNFMPKEPKTFQEGMLFNGMPEKDMAGNSVKQRKYLGAFCK